MPAVSSVAAVADQDSEVHAHPGVDETEPLKIIRSIKLS